MPIAFRNNIVIFLPIFGIYFDYCSTFYSSLMSITYSFSGFVESDCVRKPPWQLGVPLVNEEEWINNRSNSVWKFLKTERTSCSYMKKKQLLVSKMRTTSPILILGFTSGSTHIRATKISYLSSPHKQLFQW